MCFPAGARDEDAGTKFFALRDNAEQNKFSFRERARLPPAAHRNRKFSRYNAKKEKKEKEKKRIWEKRRR